MTDVAARDQDSDIPARPAAWVPMRLSGAAATQLVCRPDRLSRVLAAAAAPEGRSLMARGGGQGHGDAALNDGGAIVLTTRLDRMLSFDAAGGILVAEAGVTLGDIQRTFLPRGHSLAVCPGSSRTTLGGAIAADVHGANHVRAGSFGDHVVWLDLVTARGGLQRASPTEHPELFDATIGGMGLTGIIARAAIRLAPVSAAAVDVRRQAFGGLEPLLDALVAAAGTHAHAAAWIDAAARGVAQGRGVLQTADMASDDRRVEQAPWFRRSPRLSAAWSRITAPAGLRRLLDDRRYRQARRGVLLSGQPLERFLFQSEATMASRGRAGGQRATRFQCVLPSDNAAAGIRRLLDIVNRGGGALRAGALAMGAQARGMLSFPRPGVSLVLDLAAPVATPELLRRLERETLDRGGRAFLAYDAHLTDHGLAAMYPRLGDFRAALARLDPETRLQSDLARRLRLRDYIV